MDSTIVRVWHEFYIEKIQSFTGTNPCCHECKNQPLKNLKLDHAVTQAGMVEQSARHTDNGRKTRREKKKETASYSPV